MHDKLCVYADIKQIRITTKKKQVKLSFLDTNTMNSELAQDPEIQRLMAQQEILKNVKK